MLFLYLLNKRCRKIINKDHKQKISDQALALKNVISELNKSEAKYRNLVEKAGAGIVATDLKGRVTYVNETLCKIIGYSEEELIGKPFVFFIHPNYKKKIIRLFRREFIRPKVDIDLEFEAIHKEGFPVYILSKPSIFYYENKIAGFNAVIFDITERKIAEFKLKESEEKYRSLFDNMTSGFAYHEVIVNENNKPVDYKYIEANPAFEKLTGLKAEDIIGKRVTKILPGIEDDPADWIGRFGNVGLTGVPLIIEEYSEALDLWYEVSGYSPKKGYFAVNFTDITGYKKAEQQIKESEEIFRTITEQSFMGICILQNNQIKYVNETMLDMFEYDLDEVVNRDDDFILKIIHPDDLSFFKEVQKSRKLGDLSEKPYISYRVITKSGNVKWIDQFSKTIIYKGNSAELITIVDITEKIGAQKRLQESEEKYRLISENENDLIAILDSKLKYKYVNEGYHEVLGYSKEEMYKSLVIDIIHPNDVKRALKSFRKGLKTGMGREELRVKAKDGKFIWFDVKGKTFTDIYGEINALLISRDITEIKKVEAKLREVSKLKSELLRRISHELKTPLISIKGYTELILSVHGYKLDDKIIESLNEIQEGCFRLENLINELLKTATFEDGKIHLNTSIEDLAFLIKFTVKELLGFADTRNQTIDLQVHDKLITKFEKERVYEVISNLLTNAIKYTPPGGKISIKSEIGSDSYIISVKDQGIGLTDDEKTRIFTQFGKIEHYGKGLDIISGGTGLGLFIAKKTIELHGGNIWVESEGRNKGSIFYFSLPIIKN